MALSCHVSSARSAPSSEKVRVIEELSGSWPLATSPSPRCSAARVPRRSLSLSPTRPCCRSRRTAPGTRRPARRDPARCRVPDCGHRAGDLVAESDRYIRRRCDALHRDGDIGPAHPGGGHPHADHEAGVAHEVPGPPGTPCPPRENDRPLSPTAAFDTRTRPEGGVASGHGAAQGPDQGAGNGRQVSSTLDVEEVRQVDQGKACRAQGQGRRHFPGRHISDGAADTGQEALTPAGPSACEAPQACPIWRSRRASRCRCGAVRCAGSGATTGHPIPAAASVN